MSWYHTNSPKNGLGIFHDLSDLPGYNTMSPYQRTDTSNFLSFFCFFCGDTLPSRCAENILKTEGLESSRYLILQHSTGAYCAFCCCFFLVRFFVDKVHTYIPPCKADQNCYESLTLQASKASSGLNPLLTTTSNSHKMSYRMNLPLTSS